MRFTTLVGVNIDGLIYVQLMDFLHSLNIQLKDRLPARLALNLWSDDD